MLNVKRVLNILNDIAPLSLAENYDNVGLLIGDESKQVKKILCALDVTKDIIDEAIEKKVDLIVSHHPVIFNGIKSITKDDLVYQLIINNISCIAMHTNFDKAFGGLNDYFCNLFDMENILVLQRDSILYSISFYVPNSHKESVKNAMFEAGCGDIFEYEKCCFELSGIGQFEPKDNANQFIGKNNEVSNVEEVKIEMVVEDFNLKKSIEALIKSHPYERVAYNIHENIAGGNIGFGRYGKLKEPMYIEDFCKKIKDVLNIESIKYIGKNTKISTVGVCTGAGSDLYKIACKKGLDAYICAEVKHNIAIDAMNTKTALIDAGHYGTEAIFKNICQHHLQQRLNRLEYKVEILCSEKQIDPWQYI